jgi:tetratricopeptide (TPR) repeat protein
MDDRLRLLWDFDDLDGTERHLRAQLETETSDAGRAEVLTQIARVCGLRGDVGAGDVLLDEAAASGGDTAIVAARVDLERGRLRRSNGDPAKARPLFESAFAVALEERQHFIAADAAHMVALVAADRDDFVDWTRRGVELAELHDDASYWLGPLLNNLGWEYYERGDLEPALDAFERALRVRERDPGNAAAVEIARYAVGKALRGLGRSDEAIPHLEQAVAWADAENAPDGWFHEELAEEYGAVGRIDEAREQARLAMPLLERDDPSFRNDTGRRERLEALAGS